MDEDRTDVDGAGWASPSLRASLAAAYELKFALTEPQAAVVEALLGRGLELDPHADPALGGAYAVGSVYCDTAAWSVFYREGRLRTRKYRVRRYGNSGTVYLERKTVNARRVRKRRVAVEASAVEALLASRSGETEWFARQVAGRGLVPVCRVRYLRRAMFGVTPEGPVRVTFDRGVRGAAVRGWSFEPGGDEVELLRGVVVCEFKFAGVMPLLLKRVAAEAGLLASSASKYRACVRALGLVDGSAAVAESEVRDA